jgi:hypothetical protein
MTQKTRGAHHPRPGRSNTSPAEEGHWLVRVNLVNSDDGPARPANGSGGNLINEYDNSDVLMSSSCPVHSVPCIVPPCPDS